MNARVSCRWMVPGLLATALPAQAAAPEHLLRMAPAPGAVQCYRKSTTWHYRAGDVMTIDATFEVTVESRVAGVQDGKADLHQIVRRLVSRSKDNGVTTEEYDSETGGEKPGVGVIVGKTVTMKVDDRGRVSDFKLPDDCAKLSSSKEHLFVTGIPFAETPVGAGKTWESVITMRLGGPKDMDVPVVHKLVGVTKGKATIATELKASGNLQVPGGGKVDKYEGTTVIDIATGQVMAASTRLAWSKSDAGGMATEVSITTKVEAIEPTKAR